MLSVFLGCFLSVIIPELWISVCNSLPFRPVFLRNGLWIDAQALAVFQLWFGGIISVQNAVCISTWMIFSHQGPRYKVLFKRVLADDFRESVFTWRCFWWSVLFRYCLVFFVHFWGSSPEKHQRKILSLSGLAFCVSFSRSQVFRCRRCSRSFCLFFFFSFFFCLSKREISGSHRSHAHSPPARSWSWFLFGCVVFCSHPFRRASFFFWRFVGGVFFASVRFWDSLGTRALLRFRASDPVSWTLDGRVFGVSPSVVFVFPPVCCVCGLTLVSRMAGGGLTDPAGSLARPSEEWLPGDHPILGGGLDTTALSAPGIVISCLAGALGAPCRLGMHNAVFFSALFSSCLPAVAWGLGVFFTLHVFPLSFCHAVGCLGFRLFLPFFFFSLSLSLSLSCSMTWPRRTLHC